MVQVLLRILFRFFCSTCPRKAFLEQDLRIYCVGITMVSSSVEAELTTMIVIRLSPIESKLLSKIDILEVWNHNKN